MNIGFVLAWLCFAVALLVPLWLLFQVKFKKPYKVTQHKVKKVLPKVNHQTDIPMIQSKIKVKSSKRRPNPFDKQNSSKVRVSNGSTTQVKVNHSQNNGKYNQLLAMLNGDRAIADRLVKTYGIDKAISDLIRDRH